VVQDCRGRGGSTGTFEPFVYEADDAVATFDWVCAQPWRDGRIATFGRSYAAINQWLAAARGHRALQGMTRFRWGRAASTSRAANSGSVMR